MFSLKIAYKGKNILLGKGIDSLKKINQEMMTRFPGEFLHGTILKYQGNIINEFEQIVAIAATSPNKSLKLEAEQAQAKVLSAIVEEPKTQIEEKSDIKIVEENKNNQQKIQKIQQNNQNKILQVHDDPKKEQQKPIAKLEEPAEAQVSQQKQKIIEIDDSIASSVKQMGEEVKIQTEHKPQLIQTEIPNLQIDPKEVKCQILNEAPKQVQEFKPQIIKCTLFKEQSNEQEIKPSIIKCNIFGDAPLPINIKEDEENNATDSQLKQVQPGVYQCIFCKSFQSCNVCERKRKIDHNSKFFKIVNKIIQKRIDQIQSKLNEKLLTIISSVQKAQKQSEIKKQQQKIKAESKIKEQEKSFIKTNPCDVEDLSWNKKQVAVGQNFNWTFRIKFKNHIQKPIKACLLDEKNGEIKKINLNSENLISVGPFVAPAEAKFERTYRLCILQQDQSLQLFGPKFGFSVVIAKPQNKRILSNSFRIHIQQIKKAYKLQRSIQYLIERLKQIGINEQNFEQSKDAIPDILQTV